jgi:uncharacterized protein YbbK (DUF523 family)
MESVLVSACLLGERVRFNGGDKRCDHPIMQGWLREGRVVSVCPEVLGGLPVPRPPAEIVEGTGGLEVLQGAARVMDATGKDVTAQFLQGAELALQTTQSRHIRIAILKEGSPSCGAEYSFDGSFNGIKVPLPGVTAARLRLAGIQVFSETQLQEAADLLKRLEAEQTG